MSEVFSAASKGTQSRVGSDFRLRIVNLVGFQVGWFACVIGAAADLGWLGPFVVLLLLSWHLFIHDQRQGELRLVVIVLILGTALDSFLGFAGLVVFNGGFESVWIAPPWISALWINFGITLRHSMSWLLGRYILGGVLGAVMGPAAYLTGEKLGAIELLSGSEWTLPILSALWAGIVPLVLRFAAEESRSC